MAVTYWEIRAGNTSGWFSSQRGMTLSEVPLAEMRGSKIIAEDHVAHCEDRQSDLDGAN